MKHRLAIHLAFWVLGVAVIRVGVVPAEVCPSVTGAEIRVAIDEAADWLGRDFIDGRYVYGYDRGADKVSRDYNFARHGGVLMSLFQTFAVTGSESALAAGDLGVASAMENLIEHDDWIAWDPQGDVPVGANSLFLAGLVIRRQATGDTTHDDVMRGLGRFLMSQQLPDGSVLAFWRPSTAEPVFVYGTFATGEAAWALALLDGQFPGEGFGEAAAATLDYMATDRDRVEARLTRLPDHWAAYTAAAVRPDLLSAEAVDYAEDLAGFFGIRLRFESQRRGDGLNLALRWFPGPPAGVGTAGEGIGALRELSVHHPELAHLTPAIDDRLVCTAGFMVKRQVSAVEASDGARPELERGAWFYRGYTQMDGQQHVLSALLAALPVVESMEVGR